MKPTAPTRGLGTAGNPAGSQRDITMPRPNEITFDEFLSKFDPDVHDNIRRAACLPGTTHVVLFENILMDSSAFGSRTAMVVGPHRTYRTLEDAYATHLGDLPSQRKYPVAHAPVPA